MSPDRISPDRISPGRVKLLRWLTGFFLLSAVAGVLSGVLWWRVVELPGYVVGADGGASTTERGLTEYFAGDAWFIVIGAVVGIGLGIIAWRWFQALGWPLVVLAVAGAFIAALLCWYVGHRLGPGPFDARLAAAHPGDVVPIELTVRAKASLAVWVLGASIPVLLRSSLGPDDEEPRPLSKRGRG